VSIAHEARAVQPGELIVLTVIPSWPADQMTATAFGRPLHPFKTDTGTWKVLVGVDLDTSAGKHIVTLQLPGPSGVVERTHTLTVVPKRFPTRRLTVDTRFVEPPPEVTARIQAEAELTARVWNTPTPQRLWAGTFVRPVSEPSNSAFGSRSVFNGQPRNSHSGADFLSPAGTPIHAPNAGRIAIARDLYYSGNSVIIDHGLGLFSFFAHLSRIDVAEGSIVKAGQVLGLVGATGRVTGPHLHWTLRAEGARVDPLSLLAVLGEKP
jgi:murein DD-endopeptidase MepM/ murein hydrolase activator NlpD